jgi:hypothetical protein
MRFILAIFYVIACGHPASAQSGVSNQRDMYGNRVRDSGTSPGGVNQGTPSNGAIRNTPPQLPTNAGPATKGAANK